MSLIDVRKSAEQVEARFNNSKGKRHPVKRIVSNTNNNNNNNTNNNNRVTFAPQPIVINGPGRTDEDSCKNGTYVHSHTQRRGKQKEFFICIKKPDIQQNLNVEHRDIYSEQLIRLDQGMDILDRNGLNYNLEIDINHETIFTAHMAKLLAKSGYFFDSVVNFRPNYDFENSRIEVKNPEITPDIFSSLLDLIYFRTVKTCRDGLESIGRAAQILDMAEVVKACQELQNPSSPQKQQQQQQQRQPSSQPQQQLPHQILSHHQLQNQSATWQQQQQQQQPSFQQPYVMPFPVNHSNAVHSYQSPQTQTWDHDSANAQMTLQLPRPPCLSAPSYPHHQQIYPQNTASPQPYHPAQLPPLQTSTNMPSHHHHPIPVPCRRSTCCEREKCNHCDAAKDECQLCKTSRKEPSHPPAAKLVDKCCDNPDRNSEKIGNYDLPGFGAGQDKRDCGLPAFISDGTPPCKSPLQLLFDAMDKGASEQFHEAYNKLMDNFVNISTSKDFLNLNHHQLSFILASDSLVVPDEMFVYKAALRWIQFDLIARLKHAAKVAKAIRFPLLTWEQLMEVSSEPLLANERSFHDLLRPSICFFQKGKEEATNLGYKMPRRRRFTAA